jgi:hypothetical protein
MILNIDFLTIFIGNNSCLFKKSKVKLTYTEISGKISWYGTRKKWKKKRKRKKKGLSGTYKGSVFYTWYN